MEQINTTKNSIVKKGLGLVQCKPEDQLSLVSRKLINILLFHAKTDLDENKTTHEIHYEELHHYCAYSGNCWRLFDDNFNLLQRVVITWNALGESSIDVPGVTNRKGRKKKNISKENKSFERTPFISWMRWDADKRVWQYEFGKNLLPLIKSSEELVSFSLRVQNNFKKQYSLALYEQCKVYCGQTEPFFECSLKELKEVLFGTNSVEKYENFKDLNGKVLKPAVKEINAKSDIILTVDYIKKGRNVIGIRFNVAQNDEFFKLKDDSKKNLLNILTGEFNIAAKTAINICNIETSEDIEFGIEYTRNTRHYKEKGGAGVAGYVVKAITNKYRNENVKARVIKKAKTNKEIIDDKAQLLKQEVLSLKRAIKEWKDLARDYNKKDQSNRVEQMNLSIKAAEQKVLLLEQERECLLASC